MSTPTLPPEVKAALIEVCGRSFWYKQPLFDVFARAGIPEELYIQFEHEPKFKIARQLLRDLERRGEEGYLQQRRLVTELYKLRTLPDEEVPDRDAGLDALRHLKEVAVAHHLEAEEEKARAKRTAADAQQETQRARDREGRLAELNSAYAEMASGSDRQARGYTLEDLVKEVFALFEMRYRKAYRTEGEQIDGYFSFGGFDYLVEVRWREDRTTLQELLAFKGKVDRKIESTRGLYLSISGFVGEAGERLRQAGPANLILMDGYDLALILDGRVSLIDGLQAKVDRAAQEGIVYSRLADLFSAPTAAPAVI